MASNFWCHICYKTVPASEASSHVHDTDAPAYIDKKSPWYKKK